METPEKKDYTLSLDPNAAWRAIESTQEFRNVPTVAHNASDRTKCTRIVCMSDTHGQHREITVPKGDILIHGGDFTQIGEVKNVQDTMQYFQELAFPTTICIAGNHELTLDLPYYERAWRRFHKRKMNAQEAKQSVLDYMEETTSTADSPTKFYYLEDSACSIPAQNDHPALSIYGSPWSPEFCDWAFNAQRGQPSAEIWSRIPSHTDILITHGPPLGRGDLCDHGGRAGCYDLLKEVQERVQPRLMIYGHIHEGYGTSYDGKTLYINASNLDLEYDNVHPCTVIDLPHDPSQPARVVQPQPCGLKGEDLSAWFREQGYTRVADLLDESGSDGKDLPSGDELLDTPNAYKAIKNRLQLNTYMDLKAKGELRKALLQLHAESFGV